MPDQLAVTRPIACFPPLAFYLRRFEAYLQASMAQLALSLQSHAKSLYFHFISPRAQ